MSATYLDNTPMTRPSGSTRGDVVDHVAHAAAAIVRASLRPVAAVAAFNRAKIITAHLSGLDRRLMRDIGVNHRDEVLLAAQRRQTSKRF
jgi:hypothetical protein